MAATVAPDIEEPAFFAQRLPAAVADDDGFVLAANLANSSFDGLGHDLLAQIPYWLS